MLSYSILDVQVESGEGRCVSSVTGTRRQDQQALRGLCTWVVAGADNGRNNMNAL